MIDNRARALSAINDSQLEEKAIQEGAKNIGRFINKIESGSNVVMAGLGDSIMVGNETTDPETEKYTALLQSYLQTKYGVTVTMSNRAAGGHTVANAFCKDKFTEALGDKADLYLISFGHNDIKSDTTIPGRGYPRNSSIAGIEHMIRRIKSEMPKSDIIIIGESPYAVAYEPSGNLIAYSLELKRIANDYGCLFIDAYSPFIEKGDWDYLMYDSGHPNTLGHELIFNTIKPFFTSLGYFNTLVNPIPAPMINDLGSWKYDNRNWNALTKEGALGTDRWYSTGSWSASEPWYSNTVSATFIAIAHCSEMLLELILDESTSVRLAVNGDKTYNTLDLSGYSTGQVIYVPIIPPDITDEVLSVEVYIRGGGITVRNIYCLKSPNQYIQSDNSLITYTGAWSEDANANYVYGTRYVSPTTVDSYSLSLDFIGTGVAIDYMGSDVILNYQVSVDGVDLGVMDLSSPIGSVPKPRHLNLVSDLEYGTHTVVLTADESNTKMPRIGGFIVIDERRNEEPRIQRGIAKVGETVVYSVPFSSKPYLKLDGNGVYSTSETATSFVVSGTVDEVVKYEAIGSVVAY